MWGVYADGHKGVVLRFDCGSQEAPVLGSTGQPVYLGPRDTAEEVIRTNANYPLLKVTTLTVLPNSTFSDSWGGCHSPDP